MPAIVLNRPHPLAPGNAGVPAHPISPCSSLRRARESARPFRSSESGTILRCARLSHLPQTPDLPTLGTAPGSRSSDCSAPPPLPGAHGRPRHSVPLDSNASPPQTPGAPPARHDGTQHPEAAPYHSPEAPRRALHDHVPSTVYLMLSTHTRQRLPHAPPATGHHPKNLENAPTASPPAGIAAHGTPPGVSESQERHPTQPHYFSSSLQQHPHPSATARRQHMDKAETLPTQYPTTRSTLSRNKSACPKCREYSSTMCR
ncbi:Uncharacterised protein [Nocardia otitidiscaviarum]|uniref:Uncharacterized protein n=1 Tax=Nocardia otitidiscaviarum TaxID=1823 RepID=A0A378YMH7_9NOCA|nr:Uncharacterised protein [Nocardia otitidiscaviarum]